VDGDGIVAVTGLPAGAYAVALTLLPGVGPVSLTGLLAHRDPEQAWADVSAGRARRPVLRRGPSRDRIEWDTAARRIDPDAAWRRTRGAGIDVTWLGRDDYPVALRGDPAPPAVLFWRGSLAGLHDPCVALVGTRHATPEGRAVAFELGRDLAAAGVCVVSGLALGIDGAAHRGALHTTRRGSTIGVAASGVDRIYPLRHRELWEDVVRLGAVLSETPPGHPAQTWRFPARNRIIAGLVSMVVVVESHAAGGALITADAAIERGIEVRAVPGPVRSPASAGTNQLLYDGPGPVRDAADILLELGSILPSNRPGGAHQPAAARRAGSDRPEPHNGPAGEGDDAAPGGAGDPGDAAAPVLEAMGWHPRSLNWIVAQVRLDVAAVAAQLERLASARRVSEERGWWQRLV
jgi:DNA processing protein